MDFKDYQRQAQRTVRGGRARELQLDNWALGLAGEAGEVADIIKKHVHHTHPLDVDKVNDELGDVLWYVSVMATECGLSLDDIAHNNCVKLAERYPEGFSPERSINRNF